MFATRKQRENSFRSSRITNDATFSFLRFRMKQNELNLLIDLIRMLFIVLFFS